MDFDDFEEDLERRRAIGAKICEKIAAGTDDAQMREMFASFADRARHPYGWGTAYQSGTIYRIENAEAANGRVGDCSMAGNLKEGDLALCFEHAGDYFHNFVLVEQCSDSEIIPRPNTEFGAYGGIGKPHSQLTGQQLAIVKFLMSDEEDKPGPQV